MNSIRGWLIAGVVVSVLTLLITLGVLQVNKNEQPADNSGAYYQVYENA